MCHSLIYSLEADGIQQVHGSNLHLNKVALSILLCPGPCHPQSHGGIVGVMPVSMCQGQYQQLKGTDITAAALAL